MIVDEVELMSRLKDVEPLPPEVSEKARMVLRAAMAVAKADAHEPSSGRARRSSRRASRRQAPRQGLRSRRLLSGVAAAAVVAAGGAGAYLAAGSTSTRHPKANPPTIPSKALHANVIAYVGSSPTLAVTSLPPGYTLTHSASVQGPVAGLIGGSTYLGKTFVSPTGQPISVDEMLNSTAGTPKAIGLATQYPQAVQHVTVGSHPALLLDLNQVESPDPSAPNARIVGYVLYWPVSPTSWAMISGGSPSDLEQVGAGVVPAS